MQEKKHKIPFDQWIKETVAEIGFFDLVDIPAIWHQIFEVLPSYLEQPKAPDDALVWLFEGTGDDLPDLFLLLTRLKEHLCQRLQDFEPQKVLDFIKWFHKLELRLIERCYEKNQALIREKPQTIDPPKKEKKKKKWKTTLLHLLDTLPLGAILFNAKGDIQASNKKMGEFTGLNPEQLQSLDDIRDLTIDEEQQIKIYKYFNRAAKGEEFESLPFILRSKNNESLHFLVQTISCPGDQFLVLLIPKSCLEESPHVANQLQTNDLKKQTEKEIQYLQTRYSQCKIQLHNSFKIVERITRLLKVDIDNFHTFATLLEQESGNKRDPESGMENVIQISASLDEMMENTVEFAQLSMKRLHFAPVAWDGTLAAEEVFSHLEERLSHSSWKNRVISIGINIDEEVSVPLDFRIATEILWQLTINALMFSEKEINIQARIERGDLVFSVKDLGKGMYKTDLERVFLPLVRLNPSKSKGLGLGLAIVKEYCLLSQYLVDLRSTPGEGSIAELRLLGTR